MKKRVLAALMTVCMTVGAFPGGRWRMSLRVTQRQI